MALLPDHLHRGVPCPDFTTNGSSLFDALWKGITHAGYYSLPLATAQCPSINCFPLVLETYIENIQESRISWPAKMIMLDRRVLRRWGYDRIQMVLNP